MASRPCKPDADTKRLWQTLLPDTPMPACRTGKDASETQSERDRPVGGVADDAKSSDD
jgi:hypothetical protein